MPVTSRIHFVCLGKIGLSTAQAVRDVSQDLQDNTRWAHDNITRSAGAQRATTRDMEVELRLG